MVCKQRSQEQGVQLRSIYLSQALTPWYFCACDDCFCGRRYSRRSLLEGQRGPGAGVGQECGQVLFFGGRALTWAGETAEPPVPGGRLDVALARGGWMLWTVGDPSGGSLMGNCSGGTPAMAIPSPCNSVRVSVPRARASSREQHAALSKAFWETFRTHPISSSPLMKWQKPKSDSKLRFACLNRPGFETSSYAMLLIAFDSPDFHLQDKKGCSLQPLSWFHSS